MNKSINLQWKTAEAAVNLKLIELGYETFIPFNTGGEIDLIAVKDNKTYRIQIKSSSPKNDVSEFHLKRSSINYKRATTKPYLNIDVFLFYDGTNIMKVSNSDLIGRTTISFRYCKPKNNQGNYNYYEDYLLDTL